LFSLFKVDHSCTAFLIFYRSSYIGVMLYFVAHFF